MTEDEQSIRHAFACGWDNANYQLRINYLRDLTKLCARDCPYSTHEYQIAFCNGYYSRYFNIRVDESCLNHHIHTTPPSHLTMVDWLDTLDYIKEFSEWA